MAFLLDDLGKDDGTVDLSPALMTLCTLLDQSCESNGQQPAVDTAMYSFVTRPETYHVLLRATFGGENKALAKHCLYLLSNSIAICHSMQSD